VIDCLTNLFARLDLLFHLLLHFFCLAHLRNPDRCSGRRGRRDRREGKSVDGDMNPFGGSLCDLC
jgi:hypothetical protein